MDTTIDDIYLDVTALPRIAEVCGYANDRGISLAEAVERLVNKGLSHL